MDGYGSGSGGEVVIVVIVGEVVIEVFVLSNIRRSSN